MGIGDQAEDFEQLHALIAETEDVKGFLDGMTGFAAEMMTRSVGAPVQCAVTLKRKHSASIAGSSDDAILLDGIEQRYGQGPSHEALRNLTPTLLDDAATENRWPDYCASLLAMNYRTALGVPLELGQDAAAVLNFFGPTAGLFTKYAVQDGVVFANMAGHALRLALRITAADQLADNLKAAMESRTAINLACGILMAQNQCTQGQAIDILRRASSARSQKLHVIAQALIASFSGAEQITTYFDD
jgi:GAF domain-containing protein